MIKNLLKVSIPTMIAAASNPNRIWIDHNNRVMRDAEGRHTIHHGVNVVFKVAPYIPDVDAFDPDTSLTDKDMDDLKSWGVNMGRLGVIWEAVETAPGVYDEEYLTKINTLITRLGDKGI